MTLKFEELRVLQAAEVVADGIWGQVVRWDPFVRDVIGGQISPKLSAAFIMVRSCVSCIMPEAASSRQNTGSIGFWHVT